MGHVTTKNYYPDTEKRGGLFLHLLKGTRDPRGNYTSYTYDARGNVSVVRDAAGGEWRYAYDELGHLIATTDPLGRVSRLTYDGLKRLSTRIDPLGHVTSFSWNNDFDQLSGTTDANGKTGGITYDNGGRSTGVTDALNHTTAFGYTNGVLTSVTDARGQATAYTFDGYGRLVRATNALGKYAATSYDVAGNVVSASDANGNSFTFSYDSLSRLTGKTSPEGSYTYSYDVMGNVTGMEGPGGETAAITYNNLGEVIKVRERYPWGVEYEFSYELDTNGNMNVMWTPWGGYRYTYDKLDRVISIQSVEGKYFNFTYDAAGRRTKLGYPNGTETTYAYDAGDRLLQVLSRRLSNQTAVSARSYGYDNVGNRVSMEDLNGTHSYSYDDAYRLTGVSYAPGNTLGAEGESYAYDAVGNRTQERVLGTYSHNAGNQLVENSSYTYTYDNNGNLTRKTSKATAEQYNYTYNSHNQLTRVEMPNGVQVDYKYDLFGNRVEKVVSTTTVTTTRYVYSGEDIIGILDGSNNVVSRVLHGPGIDEPMMIRSGANEAYLYADGLGSIIAVADANATLQETVEYGAYGQTVYKDAVSGSTSTVSNTGNPYGYTGREPDAETGLYYYRARYYDVEAGRFIQSDPIGFKGGINLYAYANNDPLSTKDPYGYFPALTKTMFHFVTSWWMAFEAAQKPNSASIRIGVRNVNIKNLDLLPHAYISAGKATYSFVPGESMLTPGSVLHNEPVDSNAWFYLPTGLGGEKDMALALAVLNNPPARAWNPIYTCHLWTGEMVGRIYIKKLLGE